MEECCRPAVTLKGGSWENKYLDGTAGKLSPLLCPCTLEWREGEKRGGGWERLRELAVNQGLNRELGGLGWQVFLKGART